MIGLKIWIMVCNMIESYEEGNLKATVVKGKYWSNKPITGYTIKNNEYLSEYEFNIYAIENVIKLRDMLNLIIADERKEDIKNEQNSRDYDRFADIDMSGD